MSVVSAYEQLKPVEREYVDGFMRELESIVVARGYIAADYIAAGFPGMQDWLANPIAQRALVRAALSERSKDIASSNDIIAYKLLREVKDIALGTMRTFVNIDEYGYFKGIDLTNVTDREWAAVAQLEYEEKMYGASKVKIKMHSKLEALNMLFKHLGLYDADNAQRRPLGPSLPGIRADATQGEAADEYARHIEGQRA